MKDQKNVNRDVLRICQPIDLLRQIAHGVRTRGLRCHQSPFHTTQEHHADQSSQCRSNGDERSQGLDLYCSVRTKWYQKLASLIPREKDIVRITARKEEVTTLRPTPEPQTTMKP